MSRDVQLTGELFRENVQGNVRKKELSGVWNVWGTSGRQRRRQGGQGGLALWIKSAPPPARGLVRHNKRFTIEEIIKIVATRCQILRLKCTKSFVGWGSAPDPTERAYSASPDP